MFGNSIEYIIIIPLIMILIISLIALMIYSFTFSFDVLCQHRALLRSEDYDLIKNPYWAYTYQKVMMSPVSLNTIINDFYYYLLLYKERLNENGDY